MTLMSDTIVAASIAGGVSFIGLLIAKQSKVSEFRQEWIDALRGEVATLISLAVNIFESGGENQTAITTSYTELHRVTALISLRLNPKEKESKALLTAMNSLRDVIHTNTTFDAVQYKVTDVISASQAILKNEWRRVKTGEFFYRWVFRTVVLGTAILLTLFITRHAPWAEQLFSDSK